MAEVRLTLSIALKIIDVSFAKAGELRLKPLSVAVLDSGGNLIAFQRQDGASIKRFEIARGKAAGALALGVSSRAVAAIASERPSFVAALGSILHDGVVPAAGGVLISAENIIIGAVGATGDTSDNDEACVLEGIKAAGLSAFN